MGKRSEPQQALRYTSTCRLVYYWHVQGQGKAEKKIPIGCHGNALAAQPTRSTIHLKCFVSFPGNKNNISRASGWLPLLHVFVSSLPVQLARKKKIIERLLISTWKLNWKDCRPEANRYIHHFDIFIDVNREMYVIKSLVLFVNSRQVTDSVAPPPLGGLFFFLVFLFSHFDTVLHNVVIMLHPPPGRHPLALARALYSESCCFPSVIRSLAHVAAFDCWIISQSLPWVGFPIESATIFHVELYGQRLVSKWTICWEIETSLAWPAVLASLLPVSSPPCSDAVKRMQYTLPLKDIYQNDLGNFPIQRSDSIFQKI